MKPIPRRLSKRYSHVSGLAQRTAIFEGVEFDLIFDDNPKSVIATVNSFSENKTLLKSIIEFLKVLHIFRTVTAVPSPHELIFCLDANKVRHLQECGTI